MTHFLICLDGHCTNLLDHFTQDLIDYYVSLGVDSLGCSRGLLFSGATKNKLINHPFKIQILRILLLGFQYVTCTPTFSRVDRIEKILRGRK